MSRFYGIFRRTCPREKLDGTERRQRDADEAWDLRNEALADALDTLVGTEVALKHEVRIGRVAYPKNAKFIVLGRVRATFIVSLERDKSLVTILDASDVKRSATIR